MARNRSLANRSLPVNLYCRNGYYAWRDPRTGSEYGLGRDKRNAIGQAIEANAQIKPTENRLIDRLSEVNTQTFGAWTARYEIILGQRGLSKKSMDSVRAYLVVAKKQWSDRLIADINTQEIAELLKLWTDHKKQRMASHVRNRLVDCFREAIAAGWLDKNPAEVTKVYGVKTNRSRLTIEQFKAIYTWSVSPECKWKWLHKLLMLALLTGQRRGDLSKISKDDVYDNHLWIRQTKTGSPVALSLDLFLDDFPNISLGSVIDSCQATYPIKTLIHHERSLGNATVGQPLQLKLLSSSFATAREKAGILMENPPTFHEIRSLSGRLYEKQYGKDFSQALWGHRNPNTSAMYLDSRGSEWVVVKPI